jgi:hypothetical protein
MENVDTPHRTVSVNPKLSEGRRGFLHSVSWCFKGSESLKRAAAAEPGTICDTPAMLRETFESLLANILAACQAHYGDRLVSLAVFGSVARQTQRPDSDIDLLIVADGLPNGRLARVADFDAVERGVEAGLRQAAAKGIHTRLSPIFKTPAELEIGSPLLLDMVEDARILFDRDATLQGRLDRLRARLVELKARRIRKGGGYYWQLKPDFKPGDEIQL